MNFLSFVRRAAFAGAVLLGLNCAQAQARTITVTNTNDSGPGSLRQAVLDANNAPSDDIITLDGAIFVNGATITLTTGEIAINNNGNLAITGPNPGRVTISGNNASRIFNIGGGANLTLTRLDLWNSAGGAVFNTNGTLTVDTINFFRNSANNGVGGAIFNQAGTLTVRNSSFEANTATGGSGGAISNSGTLIVDSSTFSSNSAVSGFGGAINNSGTVTINSSTFSRNNAGTGFGGAVFNYGTLTLNTSTFSGNGASTGGAISNSGTSLINNSTFANNTANNGLGGAFSSNGGSSTVNSSTFANNQAGTGLGGAIYNGNSTLTLTLNNNIVAGNTATTGPNIYGTVAEGDYNLVQNVSGATLSGSHNIIGQDPRLGPLTDNGGLTQTFMLLSGSPAIDAGNSAITTDQRGFARPRDIGSVSNAAGGNGSDIGSVELNEAPQNDSNLVVNQTGDHNDGVCGLTDCTLRDAMTAANADGNASAITFDATVFANKTTIEVSSLPAVITNMSISGPNVTGAGVTLKSAPRNGLMYVTGGVLSVAYLTFTNSQVGGLTVFSGTATANSCTFSNNNIGIQNGGNSQSSSAVTVNNCTFRGSGNTAIFNSSNVSNSNVATVNSCTLANNSTGVVIQGGTVNASNSIVVGNATNINNIGGTLNSSNNITTGTATQAGLDPRGLQDNGGPTPTIALVAGGSAIDTGVTTLPTDQRGQSRGSLPDIGAFELNNAPSVVSVAPQGASDKVGTKRVFSLSVRDVNGTIDIAEMWLLINTRLDWAEGATLIYFPQTGQLYLRKGDTFLPPIKIGSAAGASDILDNGALRVVGSEVSLSGDATSLTLTIPATVRDGLVGQNTLYGRVQDRSGKVDPAAASGASGFVSFGPYTVTPQFAGSENRVPTLSALSPKTASTVLPASGVQLQTFVFYAKDEDGIGDLDSLWFVAGKQRDWTGNATFVFIPRTRRLYLRSDDGQSFLGGGQIGTQGTLQNSQVSVNLAQVQYLIYADGKNVGLRMNLQAKNGLLGQNKVWLRVQDNSGATSTGGDALGFVQSGTWNVSRSVSSTNAASPSAPGS